jgi:hypothetical protein
VHLAPKIGERLNIRGFRPERSADALSRNRTAAAVKDQEGNQLLLPDGWDAREGAAIREDAKAPEQIDA